MYAVFLIEYNNVWFLLNNLPFKKGFQFFKLNFNKCKQICEGFTCSFIPTEQSGLSKEFTEKLILVHYFFIL